MKSLSFAACLFLACTTAQQVAAQEVHIQTTLGEIDVALDAAKAPRTVANFLRYAREGHFDGTMIYRVVPNFVLQMGSYDAQGNARPAHEPIPLESGNGLLNARGTVSMARGDEPASATAEFFINLSDNGDLDPKEGKAPNTTGYAVFGKVVEGMGVVDMISRVPLKGGQGPFPDADPAQPIVIKSVTVVGDPPRPVRH